MLLDEVMPEWDEREVHSVWVPAPPDEAYDAVAQVSASEVRLFRPLMLLRSLGRTKGALDPDAPLLPQLPRLGFVELGERPGEEVVVGAIGTFWKVSGGLLHEPDFAGFSQPGYARAAMGFTVRPEGSGSRVTTETRIQGTDAAATRSFRRYWRVVRPGSGLIRRSWLKAVRRRFG